jgi:acetyl-CoA carboxylase biotin carboxyl carrier protein
MNLKEIKELIQFLKEEEITEFELERGDVRVRIKRGSGENTNPTTERIIAVHPAPIPPGVSIPLPSLHQESGEVHAAQPRPPEVLHMVRSPMVGTYYESPSPGSPPFVKPGDSVDEGQVLCIVEAMKIMNEIESDMAGEIIECLLKNGQPIEYGQELFAIRPKK